VGSMRTDSGLTTHVWAALIPLIAGSFLLGRWWRLLPAGILVAIVVVAWRSHDEEATWLAALGLIIVGIGGSVVPSVWVAAAVAGSALLARPALRSRQDWLRFGTLSPAVVSAMVVTVTVAGIALAVWAESHPRLSPSEGTTVRVGEATPLDQVIDQAQRIPWWLFLIAAVVFAVLNALAEEFVYRGIVLQALLPAGSGAAIVLGAIAFGSIHLGGIPSGWWGVAMASAYGGALGWLRIRSHGLAAPVIVHIAADVVIAHLVRYTWP